MTLQKTLNSFSITTICIFSLCIIGLSLLSVIFPAFLIRLKSNFIESNINPFEFGFLSEFLFLTNFTILFFIIFCKYTLIGKKLSNYIYLFTQIKISEKTSILCLVLLISTYAILTFPEIQNHELWGDYYNNILPMVENFNFDSPYRLLENFLLITSIEIFDNIRVIPFISSILLLFNVFFTTKLLSKNNLAGIIAVLVMLQSYTFLKYDTYATYTTFWINLYLFSVYLIHRKQSFSIIPYIFSLFTKVLTAFFIPVNIFIIANSNLPKKNKIISIAIYGLVGLSLIIGASYFFPNETLFFDDSRFWNGFSTLGLELRFDYFLLLFLLPIMVGLLYLTKYRVKHSITMILLISFSILLQPISSSLGADILPYRYLPLIVFFSIAVGLIFSKIFISKELSNSKNDSIYPLK